MTNKNISLNEGKLGIEKVCSPVSTASTSNQSDDPEIGRSSDVAIMSQYNNVEFLSGITNNLFASDSQRTPEQRTSHFQRTPEQRTSHKTNNKSYSKSDILGTTILCIMIITTFVSPYVIYSYMRTFEEPDIWSLKCSVDIDNDHKNYNKSNPLDLCNEITDDKSSKVGSLDPFYPIRDVEDNCLAFIIIVLSISFVLLVLYFMDHSERTEDYATNFIFLVIVVGNISIVIYGKTVDGSNVCPLLEDTFSYLESDNDNDFPDYKTITSDECEDLFSSIPGWIFTISPFINLGIFCSFFLFLVLFLFFSIYQSKIPIEELFFFFSLLRKISEKVSFEFYEKLVFLGGNNLCTAKKLLKMTIYRTTSKDPVSNKDHVRSKYPVFSYVFTKSNLSPYIQLWKKRDKKFYTSLLRFLSSNSLESLKYEKCVICLDKKLMFSFDINNACGNCNSYLCDECFQSHYGYMTSHVFTPTRLHCPVCRKIPTPALQSFMNPIVQRIYNMRSTLDDDSYYSNCSVCNIFHCLGKLPCSQGEVPTGKIICEKCQRDKLHEIKRCPSCKNGVIKAGNGCNHIRCRCGEHFCYKCLKGFGKTSGNIYNHMRSVHGRIYN